MKQKTKKVLKKKPLKKTAKTVEEEFEDYEGDDWEAEAGSGADEPRRLKPLRLRIVATNKYDVIVQDINTKYMYAVEKYYNAFAKSFEYGLRLLGA